jgi:hypothetical protein
MSGRSAKEALDGLKKKAESAYKRVREVVQGGDPEDVPLGDGLAGKAAEAIKSRRSRLDEAIERDGG